jgi:BlaI family transcriptional regulator, penicillinase repressor
VKLALPQLEIECMKVLWRGGEASVAQVRAALPRPLAYTTVMTVLDRMASKGVVARRKQGRAFLYSAALDRAIARSAAVARLLENYFDGDRRALATYLGHFSPKAAAVPTKPAAKKARAAAAGASFSPAHIDESLL